MSSGTSRGFSLRNGFQRYFSRNNPQNYRFPIPRQQTPYSYAKIAEYIEKDLSKAEVFYRQAIEDGERPESALKDLAGVLHQQGKTKEACELLESHKHLFVSDQTRYENLLKNLQKQIFPSQNTFNKAVKINGLGIMSDELTIRGMFQNASRILHIEIGSELDSNGKNKYAVVRFASHSAARKTLEGLLDMTRYKLEWVSVNGEITGEVVFDKSATDGHVIKTSPLKASSEPTYYSYFADKPCQPFDDIVDELLENSIFTYFKKPSSFEMSNTNHFN
ncbi:unnamed protein product [Blepharisma stoltei]|uniref:RRM domain-containing protein n=1 Tax=Blepharisma stoltei TaxID=1481888 RepID=A0AAU9J7R4_9CILI|nr:unnamed protein product [Blepharisma stoltei]